ncbi:hypothetical protein PCC8801_1745 [Rippkaea orientalis PCC 8801]|uniref:DUF2281 domain-containing protein n=1 Tax=Rippkaea orientalis (strain PCC 8801 / RF-1) TaxID=41431 RepID=B7JWU3_RIPO1|nr:DUF2281 domain-containing protein [Rippkaea orientalis]ACK65792.1 hypothetical protein PCC8801_1745 [Rippkaea orientalis PCC 8801]
MTTKKKLIEEIENLPDFLLLETLDFICFLKAKYTQQNRQNQENNEDWLHQYPFQERLEQALEWNANNPPKSSNLEALEAKLDSYE